VTGTVFGPYRARCDAIHDGDSIYFSVDLGFDHLIVSHDWDGHPRMECRVYGINAPELSTEAGKAALAYAQTLLKPGDVCQVTSHGWDKYGGRFDGTVTLPDGTDFAGLMLSSGHAIPMAG
jgi:endonuclease YncB( thermonuclease family)